MTAQQLAAYVAQVRALIGDLSVKRAAGHSASLTAYAYAALFTGTISGCGPTSETANVNLDGIAYNRSPRTVASTRCAAVPTGTTRC